MLGGFIALLVAGFLAFAIKWWWAYRRFKADKTLYQLSCMNRRDFEIYISKSLKRHGREKVKV